MLGGDQNSFVSQRGEPVFSVGQGGAEFFHGHKGGGGPEFFPKMGTLDCSFTRVGPEFFCTGQGGTRIFCACPPPGKK